MKKNSNHPIGPNRHFFLGFEKRAIWWVLLGLLGYFFLYWRNVIFSGTLPVDASSFRGLFPSFEAGKELLRHGLFLWDPFRGMGTPFLASPPNQALYPIRFISPLLDAFDYSRLYLLFHVALLSFSSALFAWRWTRDRWAALFTFLALGFNGFVLARATVLTDFAVLAWIPLLLLFMLEKRPLLFGVILALQWMGGYPPFFILSFLIAAGFGCSEQGLRATIRFLMKGAPVGIGLAAIQIIPFIEALLLSARPVFLSPETVLEFSLHPLEGLRQVFIPAPFVNWINPIQGGDPAVTGFYFGPVVLVLFLLAVLKGGRRERIFGGAALAAFILALGGYNGFYSQLVFLNFFRFPSQWILVFGFFLILAALKGFSSLRHENWKRALVLLAAVDLFLFSLPPRALWADKQFVQNTPRAYSLIKETLGPGRIFHERGLNDLVTRSRLTTLNDWLAFFRILPPSLGVSQGFYEVSSYLHLPSKRQVEFEKRLNDAPLDSKLFKWAGVKRVFSMGKARDEGKSRLEVIPLDPGYDRVFHAEGGEVHLRAYRPGRARIEVEDSGRVVLNETFTPGWKAFIDGKEISVEPFEDTFISVKVNEPGALVELIYRPISFFLGLIVSLTTALILLFALLRRKGFCCSA